jgi:diacylglycerol kinase (ATP)
VVDGGTATLIVNPQAAGGRSAGVAREARAGLEARGVAVDVRETRAPGAATDLALVAAREGASKVVAVGGDGTVHEVVEGLVRSGQDAAGRPALGVIPGGTGNDFAKLVGVERDLAGALDIVAAHRTRPWDVGRARWSGGEETFINAIGTGIDVEVVRQLDRLPRMPGVASYLVALLRALRRYRAVPLDVRTDGADSARSVMIIAVANGRCIGGGFHVCPAARPDDGWLDTCIVDEVGLMGIARIMPKILKGRHGSDPRVSIGRAREVRIVARGAEDLFFQLDGELREPAGARELHVSIMPGALRVLVGEEVG